MHEGWAGGAGVGCGLGVVRERHFGWFGLVDVDIVDVGGGGGGGLSVVGGVVVT